MTKQDYEALAALLKANRNDGTDCQHESGADHIDNLARDMAQYMTRYPAFDQAKFLAAAGVR
jgi:hypothetical protein